MAESSQEQRDSSLAAALAGWREALGPERVDDDAATLDRFQRSTHGPGQRALCVLAPRNTAEVQRLVRVAQAQQVALYPISRGKNWGYGDACPPRAATAIVDLGGMDRIVHVDDELAYAVIEAGVSAGQLSRYLGEHHPGLWMDCTGAGPDASLVGNTLDRGFGHTRLGDHFLSCCGMEVVLADGELLRTGFGHFEGARATHLYRYGVGPFLDGLFCQANLGIVTQIGLWLVPAPEALTMFAVQVDDERGLVELVDRLRPLRMQGLLRSAVHIGNDLRVISGARAYPWEATGGETPLPAAVRAALRREMGIACWNASGSIEGTRAHVRATKRALKRALRGLARPVFLDDRRLAAGLRLGALLARFGRGGLRGKLEAARPIYGLLKGIPSDEPLAGPQWRVRPGGDSDGGDAPRSSDPLDRPCGLAWISPVVPTRGEDARQVVELVEPICERHGFELPVTFTMINERSMVGILNVYYDRSLADEAAAAQACYDEAMTQLIEAGYVPYRVSPQGMQKVHRAEDPFWRTAARIKRALDPQGIIAPGRYILDP